MLQFFAYLCSQYIWCLLVFIAMFPFVFGQSTQTVEPFESKIPPMWNSSMAPKYIAHFGDLRIHESIPERRYKLELAFKLASELDPDALLVTGDITDGFEKASDPRYGDQVESQWKIYSEILSKYEASFRDIIEIPGDQDMFGIKSVTSEKFNYAKYTMFGRKMNITDERSFSVIRHESGDIDFVLVNPFRFPTTHPPLLFYVHPTSTTISDVQKAIEESRPGATVVLASHYPASMFRSTKTAEGDTYGDVVENARLSMCFSGHIRSDHPRLEHRGTEVLEVIGQDIYDEDGGFGVATFDNGRAVYHTVDPENPHYAFIMSPVPLSQVTVNAGFADRNTYVRLLVFGNATEITCTCKNVTGHLEWVMDVRPEVSVWEYNGLELEDGEHYMTFGGDCGGEVKFVVGKMSTTLTENVNSEYYQVLVGIVATAVGLLLTLFITLPFDVLLFESVNNWIFDKEYQKSLCNWIVVVFAGFVCVRGRVGKHARWVRIVLFCACLWPLVLPIALIQTEDQFGFIWLYGYVIGGCAYPSEYTQLCTGQYYAFVILPALLMASALGVARKAKVAVLFECISSVIGAIFIILIVVKRLVQACGPLLAGLSFEFVLIPVTLFGCLTAAGISRSPAKWLVLTSRVRRDSSLMGSCTE